MTSKGNSFWAKTNWQASVARSAIAFVVGMLFVDWFRGPFLTGGEVLTGVLVIVASLTWLTYERLATLTERQNWLTGSLESHSTGEHIMRAHERGIPVIWWNPHREKWNAAKQFYDGDRHRKIAQQPFIVLFVPEDERGPGNKKAAKDAKPFTSEELRAIGKEQKRLARITRSRK